MHATEIILIFRSKMHINLNLAMVFLLQEDRFSKCDTCVKINGLLERMGSRADPDIKKRKQEHLKVVE